MANKLAKNEFTVDVRLDKNLRYLRRKHKSTRYDIQKATGIHSAALKFYEDRDGLPMLYTTIILAKHFGLTLDELVYTNLWKEDRIHDTQQKPDAGEDCELQRGNDLGG
jgi:DNA-binding XRE family transcriptional regulator